MFTGNRPANLHADFQQLATKLFTALHFARLRCVVENHRVQIAVASVEYVCNHHAVFCRQLLIAGQYFGKAATRDRAIHGVVVRANGCQRSECTFTRFPEFFAFIGIAGTTNFFRVAGLQYAFDFRHIFAYFLNRTVNFDQ